MRTLQIRPLALCVAVALSLSACSPLSGSQPHSASGLGDSTAQSLDSRQSQATQMQQSSSDGVDAHQSSSSSAPGGRPCNTSVPDAYTCAGGPLPADSQPLPVFDAEQNITALVTPSGNITCDSYDDFVQCRVGKRWPAGVNPIRRPGGPMENAGIDAVTFRSSGPVSAGVATDAPPGTPYNDRRQVLPYGSVWHHGNYVFASGEAGLTVWNVHTGYGALINRDGYFPFGP